MNELQFELLKMYKELRAQLIKYNVKYFAIGGTGIGALRHKGFIPGDDDMDFAIVEEDLEKFKNAIKGAGFSLKSIDGQTGKEYKNSNLLYHMKVYKPTIFMKANGRIKNLYIDFMIAEKKRDGNGGSKARYSFYGVLAQEKRRTFKEFIKQDGLSLAICYKILVLLFPTITSKRLKKKMRKLIINRKILEDKKDRYGTYHAVHNEYWDLGKIENHKFEDTDVPLNDLFEANISRLKGDIGELPPEEQRINSHDNVICKGFTHE